MLRRQFSSHSKNAKRLLFMGSPDFAANVLQSLNSMAEKHGIEIVGVVTQPSCKINGATPVGKRALSLNIPHILTPVKPNEATFIDEIKAMKIDICLTVAYGGFLPQKFLDIPSFGVYNIHPSLLPLYRGAAPVQRCIGENAKETGVTVLKTVLKMDAGPILKQSSAIPLNGHEKAVQLYEPLFTKGLQMFVQSLDNIFKNKVVLIPQNHALATYAKKIELAEAHVHFGTMSALEIYNRYRMLDGYLGLRVLLKCMLTKPKGKKPASEENSEQKESPLSIFEVILCDVHMISEGTTTSPLGNGELSHDTTRLRYCNTDPAIVPYYEVTCANNTKLGIRSLQFPTKKALTAKEFQNGIRKEPLYYHV